MLFAFVLFCGSPAYAEDTEIYFSAANQSGSSNILMMLDTSGSMAWCSGTSSCGDPDKVRMNQLKEAFTGLLASLGGNVRMGLGRLNGGDGGYILYPVRGLNETTSDTSVNMPVGSTLDDAVQVGVNPGDLSTTGNSIALPNGGVAGGQSGFIFRDINIPRHAQVTSAILVVQAAGASNDELLMNVDYEIGSQLDNFAVQPVVTRSWVDIGVQGNASVLAADAWADQSLQKIDVSAVVARAMTEATWCGGSDIALRLESLDVLDSRNRAVNSYDGIPNNANGYSTARLVVEWDPVLPLATLNPGDAGYEESLSCKGGIAHGIESSNDDADQQDEDVYRNSSYSELDDDSLGAYRFVDVNFDARASETKPDIVKKATLRFMRIAACLQLSNVGGCGYYNSEKIYSGTVNIRITGVAGDAGGIRNNDYDISGRSVVSTTKDITLSAATADFVGAYEVDITAMVEEMLGHSGWTRNGSLMFILEATDAGNRNFRIGTVDGGAANGASLKLDIASADMSRFVPLVRDKLVELVNGLQPGGGTPMAEAHTEMVSYMTGNSVYFGGSSHPDTKSGSTYRSPLAAATEECASNNIVLMTDGDPNSDAEADQRVRDLTDINATSSSNTCTNVDSNTSSTAFTASFSCMAQLAAWSKDRDKVNAEVGLDRSITTHTVGFYLGTTALAAMESVSTAGGGSSVGASDAAGLQNAFSSIINGVTVENGSLAAPGVAVNQLNRFQHLDQLYYGVFKPNTRDFWEGNVKRYRLDYAAAGGPTIVGEDGAPAVEAATGFFREDSDSFWGALPDGQAADKGGARDELANRKLFVSLASPGIQGSASATTSVGGQTPTLFSAYNSVAKTALGLPSSATTQDRVGLFDYLMASWGDPLHSEPVLVNYGFSGSDAEAAAADPSLQDNTIFVAANDGMLHAVDTTDGSELFSFMVAEELAKTATREENAGLPAPNYERSTYGLDGGITVWRRSDVDGNGVEHVYLYVGQRRGGNNYYAFDVTNRSAPKLMWSIQGGTSEFARLGQTWSKPALTQVKLNGTKIPVLVFGGGYSPDDHDTAGAISSADVAGNAIYIVNAYTGAKLWSVSSAGGTVAHADMKWSIPSEISVVDINFDGVMDHIYATDLAGQIFRADFNTKDSTSVNDLAYRVVTLAKLGRSVSSGVSNDRRFFAPPVPALGERNGNDVVHVVIGSGYRAHPLDKNTSDIMFVVDDAEVLTALKPDAVGATPPAPLTRSDLTDISSGGAVSGSGWYYDLTEPGEKVMSAAAVINNRILWTTYLPDGNSITNADACAANIGGSRLYNAQLGDGGLVDGETSLYKELSLPGLPPQPQVLVHPDALAGTGTGTGTGGSGGSGDCPAGSVVIVGTQAVTGGCLNVGETQRTRWYELDSEGQADAALDAAAGADVTP
jgi:Tfp pilus tip-associated adhesin PilY1